MITQGKRKRKLEDDSNVSSSKVRRINIKNEPEQVSCTRHLSRLATRAFVCLS